MLPFLFLSFIFFTSGCALKQAGSIPPRLGFLVYPVPGLKNAPINTKIEVVFDQPLDTASLKPDLFILLDSSGRQVPATVDYQAYPGSGAYILMLIPLGYGESPPVYLKTSSIYTVTLGGGIKTESGGGQTSLSVWSFTTNSVPDFIPPIFGGVLSAQGLDMGSIQVTWGPAVDDPGGTPASQLVFSICYSTSSRVCQTRFIPVIKSPSASIDSNGNFSLIIKPLKPATTYYFLVRVEDLAGNRDSNTVTVSGSTMAGKLYLSNYKKDEILAFDKPSTFGRNNIRSIKSSHNGLTGLYGIFYDQVNNRLYISTCQTSTSLTLIESNVSQTCLANTSKIAVYNNTATLPDKDQIPDWTLAGASLNGPVGLFLDNSLDGLGNRRDTLYVANFVGRSVAVYDNIGTSCGSLPAGGVCTVAARTNFTNNDLKTPFGIAYDSINQFIYVSNYIKTFQTTDSLGAIIKAVPGDSVLVLKDNGTTLSEVKMISGFNSPSGLWLDLPSDTLYIANPGAVLGPSLTPGIVAICNVSLIPSGTQGIPAFSTPCTTASPPSAQYLTGTATGFLWPVAIAMTNSSNSANPSLYFSDYSNNNVSVFSPNPLFRSTTTYNNTPPDEILYGLNHMVQKPVGLAVNPSSGVENLFVVNSGVDQILFFDQISQNYAQCPVGTPPLLCTFPPTRMIGPSISGPSGLFLDSSKDRLYIGNFFNNSIVIFDGASTLSGNAYGSITKIITSSLLHNPFGIYVDTSLSREWIYVVNSRKDATGMFAVLVFDLSKVVSCPATSISCDFDTISGGVRGVIHSADFNNPAGIWVDEGLDANNAPRDILFVSNRGLSTDPFSSSLVLFKNSSALSGTISATTIIQGDQTSLFTPAGLYMDPEKDEVYVANQGYNDVLVFRQPQNCTVTPLTNICNTAPDRMIFNTLDIAHSLDAPSALTVDFSADQIYLSNLGLYNGFSSLLTINQATSINGQSFISNYFTYSTVSGTTYRLDYPEAVVLDITR